MYALSNSEALFSGPRCSLCEGISTSAEVEQGLRALHLRRGVPGDSRSKCVQCGSQLPEGWFLVCAPRAAPFRSLLPSAFLQDARDWQ